MSSVQLTFIAFFHCPSLLLFVAQRMKRIAEEWAVSEKNQHKTRRKSRFLGPTGELTPSSISSSNTDASTTLAISTATATVTSATTDVISLDNASPDDASWSCVAFSSPLFSGVKKWNRDFCRQAAARPPSLPVETKKNNNQCGIRSTLNPLPMVQQKTNSTHSFLPLRASFTFSTTIHLINISPFTNKTNAA